MGNSIFNSPISFLNILALYMILNIALSTGAMLFSLRSQDRPNASLNGVFLIGWLAAFALLTGSIGVIVAVAAVLLGIAFIWVLKTHRLPLTVTTLLSVLLLLTLRGTFSYAMIFILTILVAGVSAAAAFLVINRFNFGNVRNTLAALGLAGSCTALGYFSFFTYPLISRWIILLSAILGLFFAIASKKYRIKFIELLLGSLLIYAAFTGSFGIHSLPFSI